MIDEKILQDEMLSDEELENVAGGTRQETAALLSSIYKFYLGKDMNYDLNDASVNLDNQQRLSAVLETMFGDKMKFTIDVGKNGTGVGEKANEFNYDGLNLTNNDMVNIVNSWIQNKN